MEPYNSIGRGPFGMSREIPTGYPFDIAWPAEEEIPLMAYTPLPYNFLQYVHQFYIQYPDKVIDKVCEVLKTVEECGCTAVIAGGTIEQMDAIVRATRIPSKGIDLNLNVILNPVYLNLAPTTTLDILTHYGSVRNLNGKYTPFTNQDKIVAWEVMEQPHFWDWGDTFALDGKPGTEYVWNRLTLAYAMTTSMDHYYKEDETPSDELYKTKKRLSWFDLAAVPDKGASPSQALTDWLGSCKTYGEYLEVLDRLFKPKVWCYNFFPFMNTLDSIGNATGVHAMLDEFYRYLTLFRDKVNNPYDPAIRPHFWNYTMASEQKYVDASGKTIWHRPAPTVGMIRFQVFSSLAFGAKGTAYFMYGVWHSESATGEHSVYGEAPLSCEISGSGVDANIVFRKGGIWNSIKTVNSEVESWIGVFTNTKVIECFSKGRSIDGLETLPDKYECLNSLQTGAQGVIVSHLVKATDSQASGVRHYLVLVNLDYEKIQEVRAAFKSGSGADFIMTLAPATATTQTVTIPPSVVEPHSSATLAPGGIAVISWIVRQ